MHPGKWQKRYLDLAKQVSTWSKDPGGKVGAIVVGEHGQVLSQGYNGFPRGIRDDDSRLKDRDTKLKFTIHAEMNCIFNASLSGVSLNGSTMYVYGLPTCHECAKGIIQSGVSKLVIPQSSLNKSATWTDSWEISMQMFREAEIEVVEVKDYD